MNDELTNERTNEHHRLVFDDCGLLPHIVSTFRPFVSLYSRQAGVSGFWCHRLERPASPRHICAITRGFQTTTQDLSVLLFLPRRYRMPITIHHYCPAVLAIINII